MAKPTTQLIKMVSTADTGYFYVAKKNPRTKTEKLELRIPFPGVGAPPTAQFICKKLIKKFVADEVPPSLLADCIATWNSTTPKGNIREVMRTILESEEFWSEEAYRARLVEHL